MNRGVGTIVAWLLLTGALAACASADQAEGPSAPATGAVQSAPEEHGATHAESSDSASPSTSALPTPSASAAPSPSPSTPSSSAASSKPSTPPKLSESPSPSQSPSPSSSPKPDASAPETEKENKAETAIVEIRNFQFSPSELEVAPGTRVKFVNRDQVEHSAVADDGTFDTGMLGQDEEKVIAFESEGTFSYYCNPHTGMKGKIIVVSPS